MRVAAIDVGTNSARLLVAEPSVNGFRSIDRRMTITRLGQGVDERRLLAPDALERTLATIADYAATCGELGVSKLRVTGTSAVRDARNRDEFFDGVKALTGVNAELLSGEQEAQATFLGTLADLDEQGPVLVVDIRLVSINIGCVRMLEKHLHSDPPTETEIDALRQEVTAELTKAKDGLDVPSGARLIGVAGTVTQLATLKAGLPVYDPDVTHHFVLSHGDVRLMAKRLGSLTYAQRKRVKGLELGRADVIIAGARILLAVMETFDAAEILVSEKDILDGLVMQLLQA
jgi:exopolyphosphatase/guanosine-5'-triphosphate,3'-diphosphate pyrophosphatase